MQRPLTRRQREVLDFITAGITGEGYAPSLEEMCAHFGLSSLATMFKHVRTLQSKGYLRREWNRSRAITLVVDDGCCPTCGQTRPSTSCAQGETA